MEKCKHFKKLINSYIDDEITKSDRLRLEKHMKKCKECLDEKNKMSAIVDLCKNIGYEELPAKFAEELHEKLVVEKNSTKKWGNLISIPGKYVSILSAVAAGILIIVFLKGIFFNMNNMDKSNSIDADEQSILKSEQKEYDIEENNDKNIYVGSMRATEEESKAGDIKGLDEELPQQEDLVAESKQKLIIVHPKPSEQIKRITEAGVEKGGEIVEIKYEENEVVFRIKNNDIENISREFVDIYGESNVLLQEDDSNITQETEISDEKSDYTYIKVQIKKTGY